MYCYLHRRSIRISNFQKNKEECREQAFFCNSYRFSDTICQAVGCTGPCKCNNDVCRVSLKMVKVKGKNHRTCWKAAKTISCYLKPGGKVTLWASNQSEEESSVSHGDSTLTPWLLCALKFHSLDRPVGALKGRLKMTVSISKMIKRKKCIGCYLYPNISLLVYKSPYSVSPF